MLHPELPANIEAERATLGSLLVNRDAIVMVAPWLTAELFYMARHGQVYAAIAHLYANRVPPDTRTVADELRRRGQLDDVGGVVYLSDLTDAVPTSYHVEYYAREVERCALLRQLVAAGGQIAALGYDDRLTTDAALGSAQQAIAAIQLRTVKTGLLPMSVLVDHQYERMAKATSDDPGPAFGVCTHYRDLDEITGGLQDSDVIILAARPGVGKSALMSGMALGVCDQRSALVFSLEMSRDQLIQRMVASHAKIDSHRIRTLHMSERDSRAFMESLTHLSQLPIFIDDTPAVSVAYIRNAAYRHVAEHGQPIVLFVDYLQLMTAPGMRADDRVQVVSAISRDLKALAKELHCPIVALAQLSRAVESRTSHIPMLSDLRESGGIEQDADIVMFLYREELYDTETDKKGIAELHIAKHRNGPVGVVPLRFDACTTTFSDLTYRSPEGY
jgi:replicative DNA helicase